jgi:type VI secretion system protein ImpL
VVVNWPGTKGTNQVRVTVDPPAASGTSGSVAEGPWALLRMLDKQQVTLSTGASEKATVKFAVEGRSAAFEVTSSSVRNPMRLQAMHEFGCPTGL